MRVWVDSLKVESNRIKMGQQTEVRVATHSMRVGLQKLQLKHPHITREIGGNPRLTWPAMLLLSP